MRIKYFNNYFMTLEIIVIYNTEVLEIQPTRKEKQRNISTKLMLEFPG